MGHKLPTRTRARSRAVDVLYEARVRGLDTPPGIYGLAQERQAVTTAQTTLPSYAVEILEGVADNLERIDSALATYSRAWTLHRMPEVDLAIMRVATWEILFNPEVDGPTAITAAMQIAQERSTDESPRFINGLLGTINDLRDALVTGQNPVKDDPQSIDFDTTAKAAVAEASLQGGTLLPLEQASDIFTQIDLQSLE